MHPHRMVDVMKEGIRSCAPTFIMRRMVKEYTTRYYVPEIQQGMQIEKNRYEQARVLAAWKNRVKADWPRLEVYVDGRRDGQLSLGEKVDVTAWVTPANLPPDARPVEP